MKPVAVLGGGPAGAFAAERLASAGVPVLLMDEKLAWEKPCGGGLTYKAYSQYPFLLENSTPKRLVTRTVLAASGGGEAALELAHPLLIYSRYELNQMLLDRAAQAGARIEKTRVLELEPAGAGWKLRTSGGIIDTDFCVVATGARNPLRQVGTQLTSRDTMVTLGYYVPATREHIDLQFLPGLEGYIWVFPRCGHLSVGICGKGEAAQALRARLHRYMEERELPLTDAKLYSHLLPSLDAGSWRRNRVAGENWIAVGDAAGLVDPITGEGLYYALRSADLAVRALLSNTTGKAGEAYRQELREDFGHDLEFAAHLAKRVFTGRFLFDTVPARMVQFTRYSGSFANIMQDLFAGTQPYLTLKSRLWGNLHRTLGESLMSAGRRPLAAESR